MSGFVTLLLMFLRFGEYKDETEILAVDKRNYELSVAREISMQECVERARSGTLYDYFMAETIRALTDVSTEYELSLDWVPSD